MIKESIFPPLDCGLPGGGDETSPPFSAGSQEMLREVCMSDLVASHV